MLRNDRSHAQQTQRHRALAVLTALAGLAALSIVLTVPARSEATPAVGPLVSTTTGGLGRILVDSRGHTLYLFEKDKSGKSTCAGNCAAAWPPLIAPGKPRAGTGVKASLLGTTKRADGRMQVTYNKHPLYTFVKDTKKGQTSGENVGGFGAEWYVVSPAGAKVEPRAATTSGYGS